MNYKKIYLVGIKGVGMATLAIIAKQAGFIVAGSDVEEEFITDEILGGEDIFIYKGFSEDNIKDFVGNTPSHEVLVVATGAHGGFSNVEAEYARAMGIRLVSHGEAVGIFMSGQLFDREDIEGISVSGSHGKTTISGLIASCLVELGMDPSYSVGTSIISPIGAAGHYGKGEYFIAEADEYLAEPRLDRNPKFLYQKPKYLIINNIDFDHPDFFNDLNDVKNAYQRFVETLDESCVLFINGDDEHTQNIASICRGKVIRYGSSDKNDFKIANYSQEGLDSHFNVLRGDMDLGEFVISLPGYYNAKNSLAVISLLVELGISVSDIKRVISKFKGVKRRLELVGKTNKGVFVFDDYAHHPEEIRKTMAALKDAYKDKKLTTIFQAHTYSRTNAMLSEFVSALAATDTLLVLPTFSSLRTSEGEGDDTNFFEQIRTVKPDVIKCFKPQDVVEYVNNNANPDKDIVLTMGAGDVYKVSQKLASLK